MNHYYTLIPEKINNDLQFIDDRFNLLSIKGYSIDNLREIISIIACHTRKEENSAQLQMRYIRQLVPSGDLYLKGLIEMGVVERSGYYTPEESSFKYSFSDDYQSKYLSFPLENNKLINRIEKAHCEFRKKNSKTIRGRSEQTKYLKLLTINSQYNDFIESSYTMDTEQYNSIQASATRIINNDISYSVDSTSGRFHSNITNMPKGLRPYLRVKDEPLVNLDIKNSQPYLSTILLTNPSKVSWMTKSPAFTMMLETLKVSLSEDVKKYISLVISGQLYEFLMDEFFKEGLQITRDETKSQVLRILFARNRMPKDPINRQARQIFIKIFPKVHRIFSKVRGSSKGNKFENFKRFAILLQTIESYLMLDVILKRIYREHPGTIAITIHDSIMTGILTNNVEEVTKIMNEELTRFVGFEPKVVIENYEKIDQIREKGEEEGEV